MSHILKLNIDRINSVISKLTEIKLISLRERVKDLILILQNIPKRLNELIMMNNDVN